MDELKQVVLRGQVEKEKETARDLISHRKYMEACMHYMTLSSIFRRAAYLYPPDLAENLFTLSSAYETMTLKIRDKERGADLQKLVELKEGMADCLFFPERPYETWDHIGGLEDAKMKIKDAARAYRTFILYGPRGSGKKTLARAFARNRNIDFYEVHVSDIMTKYFGGPRHVIDTLFEKAMRSPGSVIYIQGIDKFSKERTKILENKSLMLYLMAKIEEIQKYMEFDTFVFASATKSWKMDTDICDHFMTKIFVGLPDSASRALIFKIHLTGADTTSLNMEELVNKTEGFTGKDIGDMCHKVLESMLLEKNADIQEINVRTLQNNLSQRTLKDEDFVEFMEEVQPDAFPEEEYKLWKNEFGG